MQLFYRKIGEGDPIIILHGLYGSSDNWMNIGKELAKSNKEVFLIDQRNHGHSPHSEKHNYYVMRDDLLEFYDEKGLEKATLLGHSMGGKTALFFAMAYPERVNKLIVVDIAPTPYQMLSDSDPQVLNHLNIINALYNLKINNIKTLKEAESQLAATIPYQRVRQFLLKNLKRTKEGNFRWLLNIKTIRNELPAILDGLDIENPENRGIDSFPVLFIKGEKSDYIQKKDRQSILDIFPRAVIKEIEGAGHWVHAEKRMEFLDVVKSFLTSP